MLFTRHPGGMWTPAASLDDSSITPWDYEPHVLMNLGRNMNGMKVLDLMFRPEFMRRFTGSLNDSRPAPPDQEPRTAYGGARASWTAAVACRLGRVEIARVMGQSETWRTVRRFTENRDFSCSDVHRDGPVVMQPFVARATKGCMTTGWFREGLPAL